MFSAFSLLSLILRCPRYTAPSQVPRETDCPAYKCACQPAPKLPPPTPPTTSRKTLITAMAQHRIESLNFGIIIKYRCSRNNTSSSFSLATADPAYIASTPLFSSSDGQTLPSFTTPWTRLLPVALDPECCRRLCPAIGS